LFEAKPKQNHLTAIKQQLRAILRDCSLAKTAGLFASGAIAHFHFSLKVITTIVYGSLPLLPIPSYFPSYVDEERFTHTDVDVHMNTAM